jgi:hypothetical protein
MFSCSVFSCFRSYYCFDVLSDHASDVRFCSAFIFIQLVNGGVPQVTGTEEAKEEAAGKSLSSASSRQVGIHEEG